MVFSNPSNQFTIRKTWTRNTSTETDASTENRTLRTLRELGNLSRSCRYVVQKGRDGISCFVEGRRSIDHVISNMSATALMQLSSNLENKGKILSELKKTLLRPLVQRKIITVLYNQKLIKSWTLNI